MKRYKYMMIAFLVIIVVLLSYVQFNNAKHDDVNFEQLFTEFDVNYTREREVISPFDHIKEENIHVYNDGVVIDIFNPVWAKFTDTNSMDPVIDTSSNAIQIVPENLSSVHVGDIVSYQSNYAKGIIIHRVIFISEDNEGWYAEIKGDNLPFKDPGRVRFEQIKKVTVGIIY